jgi:hypothetical protein
MAVEIGSQAKLARQKLKKNLTLLKNSSVRTGEKVRKKSLHAKLSQSTTPAVYDVRNWALTLDKHAVWGVLLFLFLFAIIKNYEIFSKLL